MRTTKWLGCFCAVALTGCSLYPIPDDVASFDTEDIVRHGRCEIRSAIINYLIANEPIAPSATEEEVIKFVKGAETRVKLLTQNYLVAENKLKKEDLKLPKAQLDKETRNAIGKLTKDEHERLVDTIAKGLSETQKSILTLANVAIVYTFDFNITENNKADGNAAFKLPFTAPKVLDVSANASLNLTRQGQRQFSAGDRWGALIGQSKLCTKGWPQHRNLVYPLDGSIGVGRVVGTFIDIAKQGGAKDSFVDTLIFTTQVGGGANAAVKLDAVPHSFRLVSATAGLSASRLDIHKMVVSIVFPRPDRPEAITGVERFEGDLNAPFDRPPDWRARYNLCVADARAREDTLKILRLEAPEVYCITYADNFAPQYGPKRPRSVRTGFTDAEPLDGGEGRANRF